MLRYKCNIPASIAWSDIPVKRAAIMADVIERSDMIDRINLKRDRLRKRNKVVLGFVLLWAIFYAAICWRSAASHAATKSDTSQSRSTTPAAIAGVVRRVR